MGADGVSKIHRHRVKTIAVTLLLVLAGCFGALPGDDGTDRSPYTVDTELEAEAGDPETDTDTEPEPEPEPDFLTPGLTDEGIENMTLFFDHHIEALGRASANGTYVAVRQTTETAEQSLIQETTSRVQSVERWSEVQTTTGESTTETHVQETWTNETVRLDRLNPPNGSPEHYSQSLRDTVTPTHSAFDGMDWRMGIARAENPDVTVEEQTRDGTTWYVVTSTRDEPDVNRVENHILSVREDGFIERESTETEIQSGGKSRYHGTSLTFEIEPEETLKRPDWYEKARG